MTKKLLVLFLFGLTPTASFALGNGSLGIAGGWGAFSNNNWSLSDYGVSLAFKGERPGELAVGYTVNQINTPGGNVVLKQTELDLRRRFSPRFGFYIGLPINYFASSNEGIIPSGVNLGLQAGYDIGIGDRASFGFHFQDTIVRNYYTGLFTLKYWASRD